MAINTTLDPQFGTGFGFVGMEEIGNYRLDQLDNGVGLVREAIERTLAFENQRAEAYRSKVSVDTTLAKEWYEMPVSGILQDLGRHGVPLPREAQIAYDVAFPIRGGGDATGTDRITRKLMTVAEANRSTQEATRADKRWHQAYILAALLANDSYGWLDEGRRLMRGSGNLTIKPLANGDAQEYINNDGASVGTDNHYLAQAGDISSSASPFAQIYEELVEHRDTDGRVEVYVARNLVPSIEDLPRFREPRDSNVTYGANESTVADGDKGIGDRYIGYVDDCHIIRMNALPAGYMFALLDGEKPLAYRQYPASTLQGLFTEDMNIDGNHLQTSFIRYGGYGVRNRTAGLCYFVGNASYQNPNLTFKTH